MTVENSARTSTHPMEDIDGAIAARLATTPAPDWQSIVDASRLLIRYDHFPGALRIRADLQAALGRWGMNREELSKAAFDVWQTGWRPDGAEQEVSYGSGADAGGQ